VGGLLAPELLARGHEVRCLTRRPERPRAEEWATQVEWVRADVLDLPSLERALVGMAAAYYLVHSLEPGVADFAQRDRLAALNFAAACSRCGVGRIIYLGALGDEERGLSPHLRSRQDTGAALRSGSAEVTELRAAQIIGWRSAPFQIMLELVRRIPIIPAPLSAATRVQPIAERDLLRYLIGCLELGEAADDIFEVGGPDVLSYQELLELFGELAGYPVAVLPVPLLDRDFAAWVMTLISSYPRELVLPLMEGLASEVVCRDGRILELIPFERTPLSEAITLALDEGRRRGELRA
jgi:uncharacterized protein YbjT (DUF2867 family)